METTIKSLFDENHDIYFTGDIEESTLEKLEKDIREIKQRDEKIIRSNKAILESAGIYASDFKLPEINLYLSTYGGVVYEGLAIYDLIKSLTKTYTVNIKVVGKAMSCGIFALQAGTKRYGSKNSTYLYHDISGFKVGKLEDIKESTEEWKRLRDKVDDIILSRTKITREMLDETVKCKKDWFMDAETALELGVIDEIID